MKLRAYHKLLQVLLLAAGLTGAGLLGGLQTIWAADSSHLSALMGGMFAVGVWAMLRDKWRTVAWISEELLSVGLLGTVIGFILAFAGLDASALAGAEAAKKIVTQLIGGTSIALYTTLVGAVGYLWLSMQRHIFGGE